VGYELLENDLTDSTLWMYRSDPARILAITIISKCNGSDRVYVPPAILIERARLSRAAGDAALAELLAPDPNSKCRLEDGRFIVEKIDEDGNRYLWLPSYAGRRRKYLARERKRQQREREASRDVTPGHDESRDVTNGHAETSNPAPIEDVTLSHKPSRVDQKQSRAEQSNTDPPNPPARGAGPGKRDLEKFNRAMVGASFDHYREAYIAKFGEESFLAHFGPATPDTSKAEPNP
jgi:hypothetical protein